MDAALQSRIIDIHMSKSTKELPLYRDEGFYNQALHLRNKLLLWRFRHLTQIDLKGIEYGFEELKDFDRRVQQVITPIYYLADKDIKQSLLTFIKEQEQEKMGGRRKSIY